MNAFEAAEKNGRGSGSAERTGSSVQQPEQKREQGCHLHSCNLLTRYGCALSDSPRIASLGTKAKVKIMIGTRLAHCGVVAGFAAVLQSQNQTLWFNFRHRRRPLGGFWAL